MTRKKWRPSFGGLAPCVNPASIEGSSQFSKMAFDGIEKAVDVARANNQQVLGTEHLMKALLEQKDGLAGKILEKAGVEKEKALQVTDTFIEKQPKTSSSDLIMGSDFGVLLVNANKFRKQMKKDLVSVELLMLAFHLDRRFGQELLRSLRLGEYDLRNAIRAVHRRGTDLGSETYQRALNTYGIDLTNQARHGKLDPVIGRDAEIEHCIDILRRRTKNNLVIVGEPGVGKTAIVEGLAQRIVSGDVPELLRSQKLISLDMGSLMAGTGLHGEFEKRIKKVLKEASDSSGQIILFIDEIHAVIGTENEARDTANLLKPALARGEFRCIGATTLDEFSKFMDKDKALKRRFQPIYCDQASVEVTKNILRGLRQRIERYHGVRISDSAIDSAAVLSDRYISELFLPDKAIDLIDDAAGMLKSRVESKPTAMDELEAAISKVEIELSFHKNENSEASENRLSKLQSIKQTQKELYKQRDHEKLIRTRIQLIQIEIDRVNMEIEAVDRVSDLDRAAELRNGNLKYLQHELAEAEKNHEYFQKHGKPLPEEEVTDIHVAEALSRNTGIPVSNLQQADRDRLAVLEQVLCNKIVGQERAVKSVADAVRRCRTRMANSERPIASLLFLGPTGVGKTELAKALTDCLFQREKAIIRLDMSEYSNPGTITRLLGCPPGYIGFQQKGLLTEAVRRRPYSVVLFDEIEKAHQDVLNLLLQLLGDARLTDSQGNTVSFANCIIIMTSNIGAQLILDTLGSTRDSWESVYDDLEQKIVEAVEETIPSEIINRIDEFIIFSPLDFEDICRVVEIQMNGVKEMMNRQVKIKLHYTWEAIEFLASVGFNPKYGARAVSRTILRQVQDQITMGMVYGDFKEGDSIMVDVDQLKKSLRFQKKRALQEEAGTSEIVQEGAN